MTLSTSRDARTHARERWSALADRLRTVTPEAIGRGVITVAVIVVGIWSVASTWPALMPFVAGAVIAYAVLPIANRLDRYMPRFLAALLAELLALAVLVGVVIVVIPPLLSSLARIAGELPTPERIQQGLANAQAQLGDLPEPIRSIVLAVATETVANMQAVVDGFIAGIAEFVTQQILQVAGTLSFVLGLLVIPVWVLTIVSDEGAIRRRVSSLIAPSIRPDVFAVTRIVDRAFGTFLRIRVLLAIVVSLFIFIGLKGAEAIGAGSVHYAAGAATLLGVLQLIPELGFFLGFFPILLVLAIGGPGPFLVVLAIYVVSVKLASGLVETRVSRGILDVHPGLLIPAIVVLSQFGPLWLLVAAPFVAILRDFVRYLAGRLAEPPMPAGVLPGERGSIAIAAAAAAVPLPSVYRNPAASRATAPAATTTGDAGRRAGSPVPRLVIPTFTVGGAGGSVGGAGGSAAGTPSAAHAAGNVATTPERSPIQ